MATSTLLNSMNQLAARYNSRIRALKSQYESETSASWLLSKASLRRQYSKRYDTLVGEFKAERQRIFDDYAHNNPEWAKSRRRWAWILAIGLIASMVCCTGTLAVTEDDSQQTASHLTSATEVTYWNADNIPIPYLQDSTQYVSNPDKVLSSNAADTINFYMHRVEQEFDIQSVVIVVNHIENDDPFRFAQDVGNRYRVGHNNRGLLIVVGYEDHSINISPGRALEADLTDAECHRLEQRYVVPGMKAEQPDSAMMYLSKALYSTLKGKKMPNMSRLTGDNGDDEGLSIVGLFACFFLGWVILFTYKNKKYMWFASSSMMMLIANPFIEVEHFVGGGNIGGGRGGFGGGGSFGGGSFGGGSFGGGGATSRW